MKISNRSSAFPAVIFAAIFAITLAEPIIARAASPVDLGTAANYAILAETGISDVGTSSIIGDIGISPATANSISGFSLASTAYSALYSTSAKVTGKVYASDYGVPTPSNLLAAMDDMVAAYNDAYSRPANLTDLYAGNIGRQTLPPNTYKWTTNVIIPSDIILSGGADDVWIFRISKDLTVSSNVKIILSGGAQAQNVFWAVGGTTTLGANSVFNGNILDIAEIVLNAGATLNGRAFSQTSVALDSNIVTKPGAAAEAPAIIITPVPVMSATPVTPMSVVVTSTVGSIIKVNAKDRPAVYYLLDGKKYLFVNRDTYTTWSGDAGDAANTFSTLQLVTQAEFDVIPLGGNLVAKPGTLIKFDNGSDTYGVATGGKLFQLANLAAQVALYGDVTPVIIQSGFRTSYYDNGNAIGILPTNSSKPK
jgi:hypothetical protein